MLSLSLCVFIRAHVCMCICVECPWRRGESDSSGAAITDSWKPPDMDAINRTWIYKRVCTLKHGTLSSPSVG